MAFHRIDGFNIRTTHEFPPIPQRQFDWSAIDDDTYDGLGSPIGNKLAALLMNPRAGQALLIKQLVAKSRRAGGSRAGR